MNRVAPIVLASVLLSTPADAQPSYDVSSVKPSGVTDVNQVVPAMFLANGQWSARGATLAMLVRSAYDLPIDRIFGLPDWTRSARFDVVTTPAPKTPPQELRVMARQLLAGRFGLRAHYEQRTNQVTALVRAHPSGVLGPGLRPAASSCHHGQAPSHEASEASEPKRCEEVITRGEGGVMRLRLRNRPLADFLAISGSRSETNNPIVDRTDLTGRFDIDIEFAPGATLERGGLEFGIPLAEAIVERLGLRFERRQEIVDVLVIDRLTAPSAN
jgi:uncharacterized protein (TIGR03435 family)